MELLYIIVIYALLTEILIVLFLVLLIPFHRLILHYKKTSREAARKKISEMIIDCLQHKKISAIDESLKKYTSTTTLLATVEAFDRRISEAEWTELKNKIVTVYLLPTARKKATSSSWFKRNFAARCFALTPLKEDESLIFKLISDPVFLVRSVAAIAILNLENKEGIFKIIKQMSCEKGYARYYYRDLLLQGPTNITNFVKEIAESETDPAIHLACLELLTDKSIVIIPHYIKDDLESTNDSIRLQAAKIVARNPQKDTVSILTKCLGDSNSEIRAEATRGFHYFPTNEVFETLQQILSDPVWVVRLQAAKTLKKMGQKGLNILKNQDSLVNKIAYDVAQTVLQYDGW